jgi:excisionase family DNA binding protein
MKPEPRPNRHLAGTLSITALARRWRKSSREIRRMLGRQELTFVMIGERIRVPESEVARWEASRSTSGD